MTLTEMTTKYDTLSAAHTYAVGFKRHHKVYVVKMTFKQLAKFFQLGRASSKRGGYAKVRIYLKAADCELLMAEAELLGDEEILCKDEAHNKGENFERELTERWTSEKWVKDSVPFWKDGDIRVNGEAIQIKFNGAELTNEKTLARLCLA